MKFNSIKFEISVLYTFILGLVLIVFSVVFYVTFSTLYKEMNYELKNKAQEVAHTIHAYLDILGNVPNALTIAAQKTVSLQVDNPFQFKSHQISKKWIKRIDELELRKDYINFVSLTGVSLANSSNFSPKLLKLFLKDSRLSRDGKKTYRKINFNGEAIQIINYPFSNKGREIFVIQVGIVQQPITQLMQNLLYSMAISIPIILLLTSFVGQLFAQRILEPVQEITDMAQKISHQDLSLRVTTKHFDDEMKNLTEAFNQMISRLEKSFRHIEEFSSHVAHELKTPLTIIKGEAELALRKERDASEYQRALQINHEECERMLKTIEDILLLARLDYQPEIFKFDKLELNEFLNDIGEQSKILARKKDISVVVAIPSQVCFISASKLHLRRLFFNLIDNAIKYTPQHGEITLSMLCEGNNVQVTVKDSGPGVSPENLTKIFDKFSSIELNGHQGNGLGLSIAQSIASIHRGKISVESKPNQGTVFMVTLPTV